MWKDRARDGEHENEMQICFAVKGFYVTGFINKSSGKHHRPGCTADTLDTQADSVFDSNHILHSNHIQLWHVHLLLTNWHLNEISFVLFQSESPFYCREYYFSDENLIGDFYLRQQVTSVILFCLFWRDCIYFEWIKLCVIVNSAYPKILAW